MPREESGEMADMVKMLLEEIDGDAKHVAEAMFGEIGSIDGVALSAREEAEYVKDRWPDPKFRAELLEQLGPRRFLEESYRSFGLKVPKLTPAMESLFLSEQLPGPETEPASMLPPAPPTPPPFALPPPMLQPTMPPQPMMGQPAAMPLVAQ